MPMAAFCSSREGIPALNPLKTGFDFLLLHPAFGGQLSTEAWWREPGASESHFASQSVAQDLGSEHSWAKASE